VEWPESFYALRRGEGCPMCAEQRADERGAEDTGYGVRFLEGAVADAYLQRAEIQRGYTIVIWRGRHVAEPTELTEDDSARYWLDVLRAARALEAVFEPVKLNYNTLGNSLPHLHTHVVPRYADDPRPGWPFPFPEGEPPPMPEERLQREVRALRAAVG
jgi:diadenosine tetraphosphate (Ap4A) HIT family hydrolase